MTTNSRSLDSMVQELANLQKINHELTATIQSLGHQKAGLTRRKQNLVTKFQRGDIHQSNASQQWNNLNRQEKALNEQGFPSELERDLVRQQKTELGRAISARQQMAATHSTAAHFLGVQPSFRPRFGRNPS